MTSAVKKPKKFNARASRKQLQAFWSTLVRVRDHHTCQWCGSAAAGSLQAAHIFGKKACPTVRFMLDNGITLCWACHFKADNSHRHEFTALCREFLGDEKFDALTSQAHRSLGSWGRTEYERDLLYLNEHATTLGVRSE